MQQTLPRSETRVNWVSGETQMISRTSRLVKEETEGRNEVAEQQQRSVPGLSEVALSSLGRLDFARARVVSDRARRDLDGFSRCSPLRGRPNGCFIGV
jgi:hypothetical protein